MTDQFRAAVASAARRLAAEGLLIGTAGNVSLRSGDRVAVTSSGLDLAECRLEDVTVVSLTGRVLAGRLQPTSELGLHLGVYADTDASAVVHTHAPYATALACVLDELPVVHYQQLLLGGSVRVAPYATFGTPELAAHVRDALAGRQAALMASHGSVTVGTTLEQAVDHALLLEWLAALYHRASALGPVRVLSEEDQVAVITAALARGYGTPQENP
ncbi:class II aldolase/adducin family protein [Nocardioides lianchengensis]|uniref:L-fuculose-phosphate aldolase n=1 Tax=Nocardioides lianchengensis TaxID=1045774 RepID=A0A1G6I043_9ACTN|nr:class II aldolase/adducin family protein [Nocardioides lianchengensis]NYG13221.1 L-fuculose-phosphate aldolase [Nocardioides lianchengensis]SDB99758.1 L-fuculose-phosphate aldolase [Nocardioides lianchengensis]